MATKKTTTKTAPVTEKRKWAANDLIACRSAVQGELILKGRKTGMEYVWTHEGDISEVEYQDLQSLYATKSRFITDPLLIIEDEELVEAWEKVLAPIYSKIHGKTLADILQLQPEHIRIELKNMSKSARASIVTLAAQMVQSGELDSISKIKAIDEELGTEIAKSFLNS